MLKNLVIKFNYNFEVPIFVISTISLILSFLSLI